MDSKERYEKDKASVISMIKYILITAIACVVIYFFAKLAIVLVPFLIGFILAKTSHAMAKPFVKLLSKKKKPIKPAKKRNTNSFWFKIFHPNGCSVFISFPSAILI